MSQKFITVLLGLLIGIQPVATDLYLSALPSIQADLSATIGQTQLTLSAMMLSFGVAQLFLGPLSDRLGRRPVLLWGVALFTLCGIATTFATNIEWLIALRALQGAAVGAAVMSGRAIVRDLFEPERGALVMSKAFSGLGVLALACALIGSALAQYLGWRWTLAGMSVYGAVVWLLLHRYFRETLTTRNASALHWRVIFGNWRSILSHRGFLAYALLSTFSFCALITFLAGSPFVLINMLGLSKLQFGLCLFCMPIFYITGTFYCRRLLRRHGLQRAVQRAAWLAFLPGAALAVQSLLQIQNLWGILAPFYIFMLAHGVMQSCGQSGAVAYFPTSAGVASALNGFLMMALAFCMSLWLGARLSENATAMTQGISFWCLLLSGMAWFVVPRFGKLPA
jgi:MFS transporter, DHA1 family, multidrug resistance protein